MIERETMTFLMAAVGFISGLWALYDRFIHRKPRIVLFAPFTITGTDSSDQRLFQVVCRFANKSRHPACIYPETLNVFLFKDNNWHKAKNSLSHKEYLRCVDLTPSQKLITGLEKIKTFQNTDTMIIAVDNPLTRIISVTVEDNQNVVESPEAICISLYDSKGYNHVMTVDFKKQAERRSPRNRKLELKEKVKLTLFQLKRQFFQHN